MVVVLRHDVDNTVWDSVPLNYVFLRLKNRTVREWGLIPHYLEDVRNLLDFEVSRGIKATWFFRTCTIPDKDTVKRLLDSQHEVGYHSDRDEKYETFMHDLGVLEQRLGEIRGATHHGATPYDDERMLEFVRKSGLMYLGQGIDRMRYTEPKVVDGVWVFGSHMTLKVIASRYDISTGRRLVSKYVKNNGLAQILMHPRQFMVSEKVRMLYNSLIESVPEQDFVTHTEIINTLRGARRATVEYTGLKPAQSQLAL